MAHDLEHALEVANNAIDVHDHYQNIAEIWLRLVTTGGLEAALAVMPESRRQYCPTLVDIAFDVARDELWKRNKIIDTLDSDIQATSLLGVEAALAALVNTLEPRPEPEFESID